MSEVKVYCRRCGVELRKHSDCIYPYSDMALGYVRILNWLVNNHVDIFIEYSKYCKHINKQNKGETK